jgi:diguanylate cyclase (GGDEF)-like protein
MTSELIDLTAIQALLKSRRNALRFPPSLEAAFQDSKNKSRTHIARLISLWLLLVYNLFVPLDFIVDPKTAWISAGFHFGMVTPYLLAIFYIFRRPVGHVLRNTLGSIIMVLITIHLMTISLLNNADIAGQYQYWLILPVLCPGILQRLDFRFAAISTGVISLCFVIGAAFMATTGIAKFSSIVILLTAATCALIANYIIESGSRLNYLLRLQAQFQLDASEQEANRDPLTGLANRRHYDEHVASIWAATATAPRPVAAVMVDIDHFKKYNDHYGHSAGDLCLQRVAGLLAAELRNADDLAVRFGGEEFVLLLPDCSLAGAVRVAERVRHAILSLTIPHEAQGRGAIVTASFGVQAGTTATHSPQALIKAADAALYAAKREGRNQVLSLAA